MSDERCTREQELWVGDKEFYTHLIQAATGGAPVPTISTPVSLFTGGQSVPDTEPWTNLKTPGRFPFHFLIKQIYCYVELWDHASMTDALRLLLSCSRLVLLQEETLLWHSWLNHVPAGGGVASGLHDEPGNVGVGQSGGDNNGMPNIHNIHTLKAGIRMGKEESFRMEWRFLGAFAAAAMALLNGATGNRCIRIGIVGQEAREAT